jgi:hypothetical protein
MIFTHLFEWQHFVEYSKPKWPYFPISLMICFVFSFFACLFKPAIDRDAASVNSREWSSMTRQSQ